METIIGLLIFLAFAITALYGWVVNIIWIVKQPVLVMNGETIVSAIGIFLAPLGSIMGLFVH